MTPRHNTGEEARWETSRMHKTKMDVEKKNRSKNSCDVKLLSYKCFWHCCIRYHIMGSILVQSFKKIEIWSTIWNWAWRPVVWMLPFLSFLLSVSLSARSQSRGELVYQYLWHLFFSLSHSFFLREERLRGEVRAAVKWLYRGETRAGRGPRLKAEWQAAEAIKIETLSLAARALLIQAGAQAALVHTHTCAHLLSCCTWTDMRWRGCRHAHVHLHLRALSLSLCASHWSVFTFKNHHPSPGRKTAKINRQVDR